MTTPNMNLIEPTPGTGGTPGPQWASEVNTNFETIDEHDHSPGKGAPIASAGLLINADLPFNGFSPIDMLSSQFQSQGAAAALVASIQVVNGELTYVDSLGQVVPITANGAVAGATGSISGLSAPASAVYSSVTKSFTWSYDSSKAARMASGDLIIYPYDGVNPYLNSITLKVPTAIAASFSYTFPSAVPTQAAIISSDVSGVLSYGAPSGAAATPGLAFNAQLNTGFYRSGANQVAVSSNGVYVGSFEPGQLKLVAGTVSLPAFTFNGDPDTGIYNSGSNTIAFAAGGVRTSFINTQGYNSILGTVSLPAYTFDGDPNTGFYSPSADSVAVTTGGVQKLLVGTTVQASVAYVAPNGSIAGPGFRFTSESDTGLYRAGTDQIGFSANGAAVAMVSASGVSSGQASTTHSIKWQTFSGSLAASANVTLLSGVTVYGITGWCEANGASNWSPLSDVNASIDVYTSNVVGASSSTTVVLRNTAGGTRDYRAIVYYK